MSWLIRELKDMVIGSAGFMPVMVWLLLAVGPVLIIAPIVDPGSVSAVYIPVGMLMCVAAWYLHRFAFRYAQGGQLVLASIILAAVAVLSKPQTPLRLFLSALLMAWAVYVAWRASTGRFGK